MYACMLLGKHNKWQQQMCTVATYSPSRLVQSESWRPPGTKLRSPNKPGEISQLLWSLMAEPTSDLLLLSLFTVSNIYYLLLSVSSVCKLTVTVTKKLS